MKYRLNPVSIGLLYLLLVVAVGCQPDDNQLCNPAPKFNIDLYIQNIEAGLTDVAGFEFRHLATDLGDFAERRVAGVDLAAA